MTRNNGVAGVGNNGINNVENSAGRIGNVDAMENTTVEGASALEKNGNAI